MPRFSVVVPAYQAASTLPETLDAILAQAFEAWECIVVDDGSSDETFAIASDYARRDQRICVIHQENQGTAGAYNTGVTAATGELIVLCSADDILLPEHMATMSAFIDAQPGYDIYSSNGYFWRREQGREPVYGRGRESRVHSQRLTDVIRDCFYSVGASYRRQWFYRVGGYRLGVYGEDYDFWLRAMALGATHRYTPEKLSLHRVTPTQKTANREQVYLSDIRLVSDLRANVTLSPKDLQAVEMTIRERRRRVAVIHQPWRVTRQLLRELAKQIAIKSLGRRRARGLYLRLRYSLAHLGRSG